jgi:hypothetical protein
LSVGGVPTMSPVEDRTVSPVSCMLYRLICID